MSTPTLGYFGKLPFSREFVRKNAAGVEMQAFDTWMQEGLNLGRSQSGGQKSGMLQSAGLWNFLYQPSGLPRFILGVLTPSQDGAGREYPFLSFILVNNVEFTQSVRFAPLVFENILKGLKQIVEGSSGQSSTAGFLEQLDALQTIMVPAPASIVDSYKAWLKERTNEWLWTAVAGEFHHPAKYWLDTSMKTYLGGLRGNGTGHHRGSLKFPLSRTDVQETFDLPFWLDLSGQWLQQERDPELILWTRTPLHGTPCVMVAWGKPSPRLILFLADATKPDESWVDLFPLSGSGALAKQVEQISPIRRQLLEDPRVSLARFLQETLSGG
jgi:type VI secretion system protein ImpM